MNKRRAGPGTLAIHVGREVNETRTQATPIYLTSGYRFDNVEHGQALFRGDESGYIYGRWGNPNTEAAAAVIAALEGINLPERPYGLLTASGMAATSTVLFALTASGDTVISQTALYGASFNLMKRELPRRGVHHDTFTGPDLNTLEAALARNTRVKLVYIESPANPTMALTDIRGVVEQAHAAGALVAVDNTFATPMLQRPLEMGADIVLHSTTKYLSGHAAVTGGAIITADGELWQQVLKPSLIDYGGVASPMEAWLTEQGLKTLHLRMARHSENALAVARYLEAHPAVAKVNYPGLESFPQYALARAQMDAFGGMLSFELKGGYEAGVTLLNRVRLCALVANLGSVDTLIQHPASMTHFKTAPEDRIKMGITDGLVRLSVGVEDIEDIIADLDQALTAVP
jgi:methionine-gamma-lyase